MTSITPELINRINQLARKKKLEGLTPDEEKEQARLRRIYLDGIRDQFKCTLDSIRVVDDKDLH